MTQGVGRIYQQTFIDTYAKVAFGKLYDRKTPLSAADLLNDRVVPFYNQHEVRLCRVLTDRGPNIAATGQVALHRFVAPTVLKADDVIRKDRLVDSEPVVPRALARVCLRLRA